jgi:hypothetical protein
MSEREQLQRVCGWNRRLASDNAHLREQVRRAKEECRELRLANAAVRVELATAQMLLAEAIDAALEGRTP